MSKKSWLRGLIEGDGYIDDRHVEIYNSSLTIIKTTVKVLKSLVKIGRIKVDIYNKNPEKRLIKFWKKQLELPVENFKLRKITSPWKARTEKLRVRVASKDLVNKIKNMKKDNSYIKGLFDAEASVDIKGYIEFKQVESNQKLVEEVHKFIEGLNIKTTPVRIKQDKLKKDAYFYVKDIKNYKRRIGFEDSEKMRKLNILLKINNRKPSIINVKGKSLWQIIEETKCPYHVIRKHFITR